MRLALLTGGSRGLGLALGERLVGAGYRVLEFSRSAPHDWSVQVDFSQPSLAARMVADTLAPLAAQPIEELIFIGNAATLEPMGPTSRQSRDAVLDNLNINFSSAILVLTEVVAAFQSHACRKVVANISSGAALKGYAGWSLYCAVKAGMENFIQSLALEQAREPHPLIAVNVNPGVMDTGMQALIRATPEADFPDVGRFIQRREAGELASPDRVAGAILRILAAPELAGGARYVAQEWLRDDASNEADV
ncbi:MAG: SDR family NAD(P)-dependent oxidoreductase [Rhodocyclaceae bacterium]